MCMFKRRTLKLFDQGQDVLKASRMLANHGSNLKETDYFSIAMRSAVMAFQKKNGLEMNATVDRKTWKALKRKHRKC